MKRHGFAGRRFPRCAPTTAPAPSGLRDPRSRVQGRPDGRPDGRHAVTTQNVSVHAVDVEKGLILLKGAVPGPKGGLVVIRSAAKSIVKEG